MKKIFLCLLFFSFYFCLPAGATIDKFYSTANTDDQKVSYTASPNWATTHDTSPGTTINDITSTNCYTYFNAPNWHIQRSFLFFDTSALPDDAVINSVSLNFYVSSINNATTTSSYNFYGVNDVRPVDKAMYTKASSTIPFSTARNGVSFTNSTWDKYILNTAGINAINKTGYTGFAWLEYDHDVLNIQPPDYASTTWSYVNINTFNNGFVSAPYLLIQYNEESVCPDCDQTSPTNMNIESINFISTTTDATGSSTVIQNQYTIPFFLYLLVVSGLSFTILFVWFSHYMLYSRKK